MNDIDIDIDGLNVDIKDARDRNDPSKPKNCQTNPTMEGCPKEGKKKLCTKKGKSGKPHTDCMTDKEKSEIETLKEQKLEHEKKIKNNNKKLHDIAKKIIEEDKCKDEECKKK